MKWQKRSIELTQIPSLVIQLRAMCTQGNDQLEFIKCMYKLKDDSVIYLYPALEFLDHIPAKEKLEYLYIYQSLNEN